MAYFQKDPAKTMAADIAAKIIERDKLVARLADAETAVVDATSATMELAVNGASDDALDKAEGKVLALRERVSTLRAGLVKLGNTIIGLENAYAEHQDKTTRRQTARECEKMADDLEEVARDIDPIFERMVEITARAAAGQIWDAAGLHSYAASSKSQIPAAIAAVATALRQHGIRVMSNMERATLLTPEVPSATVAAVEPPVVRVFTTKPVMWTDAQGQRHTAGKYCDIDLPPSIAKVALASGVCREVGGDLWRQWSGSKGFAHPDPSECENLDLVGDVVVKADPVVIDARFTRIDRGPAYQASIRKA